MKPKITKTTLYIDPRPAPSEIIDVTIDQQFWSFSQTDSAASMCIEVLQDVIAAVVQQLNSTGQDTTPFEQTLRTAAKETTK